MKSKFLNNRSIAIILAASALAASPALADTTTVSVASPLGISAVSDAREIAMPAIPGGNVGYESNPSFFQGASLSVSNPGDNWAVRHDGSLDTKNPERAAACSPIVNGRASITANLVRGATPFIMKDIRILAWAGRDRLVGLPPIE